MAENSGKVTLDARGITKKIIYLVLIIGFLVSLPVVSFAMTVFNSNGPTPAKTGVLNDFRASNNVEVHGSGNATTYAATSGHLNGDKEYGSSSGDSIIYKHDKTKGSTVDDPASSDSSQFTASNGWTGL